MNYLLPLTNRREIAAGTMAFRFDTSGTDFTFEAGQNVDLYLPDAPVSGATSDQMHTFSLASSPTHSDYFIIATRMRPTNYKHTLGAVPFGTKLRAVGPQGNMVLHEDATRPAVFLAGGIGITPFRSMIEWATEQKLPHKITMFYANRNVAAAAFLDDLQQWQTANPKFQLVATIDSPEAGWTGEIGHIDAALLQRHIPDVKLPIYYIAGPPAMGTAMRKMLIVDLGISRDNVKIESFTGY